MGRLVAEGLSVKVTVPESTTIEQGKFYYLGGFLGMAVQSVTTKAGETKSVVLNIEPGEYETSQIDTADTLNAGTKVYWDAANKVFTEDSIDGVFAGVVTVKKDANNVIWFLFAPHQAVALIRQAAARADVTLADADDTYSANERDLINGLKTAFNDLLAKLRSAGVISS